jgi:hypothetical protein
VKARLRIARALWALCAGLSSGGAALSAPAGPAIAIRDLGATDYRGGLIPNVAFIPGKDALPAHGSFLGSIRVGEARMHTSPATLTPQNVQGRDTTRFPGANLSFFTVDGDLVPTTQDVIRSGSAGQGKSYWDLIIQPGRVWAEPGDGSWSRAAFPFALVNSVENETHNGLALFAYRGGRVSNLRFQIVQQTAPFAVPQQFTASGIAPAALSRAPLAQLAQLVQDYKDSVAHSVPIGSWAQLASKVGGDRLAGFDASVPPDAAVLAGLDYQGTLYLKFCASAAGDLPWCDRARFGVWSATKALANETALLRLAQKFGAGVFEQKIADYVVEAKSFPAWHGVRFEDAINMATGFGNGTLKWNPNKIEDGYLDPDPGYDAWYEARSESAKIAALLRDSPTYPWGPGKVARYRDQDMFLLGVAMDRYLKTKEGPTASLWSMLEREVYRPIGIYYAPVNRTIESDGSPGQPLMAFGYYPTIGDLTKIARLYQNEGRAGDTQILYEARIHLLLHSQGPLGFPTGTQSRFGETYYYNAFWMNPFRSDDRCQILYPVMVGWGGNLVALFPQGVTAIRLAKAANAENPSDMAIVADRIAEFCPQGNSRSLLRKPGVSLSPR